MRLSAPFKYVANILFRRRSGIFSLTIGLQKATEAVAMDRRKKSPVVPRGLVPFFFPENSCSIDGHQEALAWI